MLEESAVRLLPVAFPAAGSCHQRSAPQGLQRHCCASSRAPAALLQGWQPPPVHLQLWQCPCGCLLGHAITATTARQNSCHSIMQSSMSFNNVGNSSWHRRRYQQSREPACCGRAMPKCQRHPSLRRSYASSAARKGHLGLSGGSSRRRLLPAMPLPAQSPAATAWRGPASATQALTVCLLLRRGSVCPLLHRSSCSDAESD